MSDKNIVNVQILRFFAALSVVFAHVGITISDVARNSNRPFDMFVPFDWGLGVDIFFVISGFIMYYLMHSRFATEGVSKDFLRRRLIRIIPLYWICTTLTLFSVIFAGSMMNTKILDPVHVVASYLFIPWLGPTGQVLPFPLLSLGWTLNYEMFFYFAFAVVLQWPRRAGLTILVASFSLLILIAAAAPADMWLLKFWGAPIIGEFLLGILLAHVYLSGRRLTVPVATAFIACGIALAVVFFQFHVYESVWRLVTGGIPAILITFGVVLAPSAGKSRPVLWLSLAGDASYALYLTHPFVVKAAVLVLMKIGAPLLASYFLVLAAAILVSILVHLFVEKNIGIWLNRLTGMRKIKAVQR